MSLSTSGSERGRLIRLGRLLSLGAAIIVFAGTILAGLGSGVSAAATAPIVVGVISTDTGGVLTGTVTEFPATVNDWKKWVNAHGGINGHQVQVIYDNDNSDSGQSVADVQAMISKHVVALLDNSTQDSAWASVATAADIPVIGLAESSGDFQMVTQPDFFPSGMTVDTTIFGQLGVAKASGYSTWGQAYCSGEAAASEAATLVKAVGPLAGVKVVSDIPTLCPSPNYTAECLSAKGQGAKAYFPAEIPLTFVDNCVQQGYHPHWIYSLNFTSNLLSDPNVNGAIGDVGTIPWFATGTPALKEFDEATHNLAEKTMNPVDVIGTWVGLKDFQTAAAKITATAKPTAADIYAGLYAMHNETLGGLAPPLTYVKGKVTRVECYYVVGVKKSKFVAPLGYKPICLTAEQQVGMGKLLGLS